MAETKGDVPISPIPIRLNCPTCGELHIDEGEFATKPHHTHSCQKCGMTWRPAVVPTVGVQFLPGFRNETVCTHTNWHGVAESGRYCPDCDALLFNPGD